MMDFKDMLHAEFTSNVFRVTFLAFIFLFGISVGSFLNVVIIRIPRHESLIKRSSHCMTCGAKIRVIDLIPVFSWLFLRGKCHSCGEKISPRYPIVESLNGLLWVLTFWTLDINAKAIITCLLISLLVVVGFMDWDTMEISEIILAIILVLAVPMHLLADECVSVKDHIIGAVVISVPFFIIGEVSRPIIRKKFNEDFRAIELGDTLLMVAAGAVTGTRVIIVSTLIGLVAAAIGGVINKAVTKESKFAFGPFLSIGITIGLLWGERIADWYISLLSVE